MQLPSNASCANSNCLWHTSKFLFLAFFKSFLFKTFLSLHDDLDACFFVVFRISFFSFTILFASFDRPTLHASEKLSQKIHFYSDVFVLVNIISDYANMWWVCDLVFLANCWILWLQRKRHDMKFEEIPTEISPAILYLHIKRTFIHCSIPRWNLNRNPEVIFS